MYDRQLKDMHALKGVHGLVIQINDLLIPYHGETVPGGKILNFLISSLKLDGLPTVKKANVGWWIQSSNLSYVGP